MTAQLRYQLLDTQSGNYVGGFPTQSDALESARAAFCAHGAGYILRLALTHTDEQGNILDVIEGSALIDQINRVPA
jgi:hypothetical protein